MNNHHFPSASAPVASTKLGPRVPLGSVWEVTNQSEAYFAEVLAHQGDRVVIRRICAKNITATPTLARFSDFANYRRQGEGFAS